MGQHEQDDLTTGMTLQMVQLNTLGQLERGHLERGVLNVAPPMRVPEEPVCDHLFRQKPVFTSLHLKSPIHVHRLCTLINSQLRVVCGTQNRL
jgi:hypothetical protein